MLQVTEQAQLAWKQKSPELLSRAEFVGGSFFDPGASLAYSHVVRPEGEPHSEKACNNSSSWQCTPDFSCEIPLGANNMSIVL